MEYVYSKLADRILINFRCCYVSVRKQVEAKAMCHSKAKLIKHNVNEFIFLFFFFHLWMELKKKHISFLLLFHFTHLL